MSKKPDEWLRQAEYDLETAEFMLSGGRYFYAVFMCHMSVEKALKGLYLAKLDEAPPRVHNLVFLLNKMNVDPPAKMAKFVVKLSEANIATRYPESMDDLQKNYTQPVVREILEESKEALLWIKTLL